MRMRVAMVLVMLVACGGNAPAPRRSSYPVPADVARVLEDERAFASFAAPLQRDLEAEEARQEGDRAARKARRFDLAVLYAIAGRWAAANTRLEAIAAEEPDPASRWMMGVTIRAWADAMAMPAPTAGTPEAFATALATRIAAMPMPVVQPELENLRALAMHLTRKLSRALVTEHLGPAARSGALSRDEASALVFQHYAVRRIVPVRSIIVDVVTRAIEDHLDR